MAHGFGWKQDTASDGGFALSKDGEYCHHITQFRHNGKPFVDFVRYSSNYSVDELADDVGAVSEYDEEFEEMLGGPALRRTLTLRPSSDTMQGQGDDK